MKSGYENVLTLVATTPHPPLEVQQIRQVRDALGVPTEEPQWLTPGVAADVYFGDISCDSARDRAELALAGCAVDVLAQPRAMRRKKLLLADMDSTMIEQECLDELADAVGLKAETAAITERAMRGELDFATALRERVSQLRGLDAAALEATLPRLTFTPGGKNLIQTMRAHGAVCHLVSGGFRFFTRYVATALGFDGEHGNRLLMANGQLTGGVEEPILDQHAKLAVLKHMQAQLGIEAAHTLAVGDGANDVPMLQAAGLGVAFHAKPKVNALAAARVRYSDLTALLYAQGYRPAEHVHHADIT